MVNAADSAFLSDDCGVVTRLMFVHSGAFTCLQLDIDKQTQEQVQVDIFGTCAVLHSQWFSNLVRHLVRFLSERSEHA